MGAQGFFILDKKGSAQTCAALPVRSVLPESAAPDAEQTAGAESSRITVVFNGSDRKNESLCLGALWELLKRRGLLGFV